jgi:F-type H+-transporting ATPase subunit b
MTPTPSSPTSFRFGRALRGGLLAAPLLLTAATALAAEGGVANPWMELFWKAVNFTALMVLLWVYARKPLANLLRGAAKETRDELTRNREETESALRELAEQRGKIENLEAELQRLLAEAKEEAAREQERLTGEARAQAERIKTQMELRLEQEFNKARSEMRRQLAEETVRLAEELIRRRLDDSTQARLTDRTIDSLGGRS